MRVLSIGWRRFLLFLPVLFILAHVISVSQLHQDSIKLDGQKRQAKKFDHLVLGPAAGKGLPNRLQCEGTKALSKIHLLASSTAGRNFLPAFSDHIGHRESVTFVTVFTIYNSTDRLTNAPSDNHVTVGTMSYTKVERSLAILNVFINFIQVTMPESNVIILTDPASNFSLSRSGVTIFPVEGDYSRDKLMLQRIKSYIAFLETRLHELRESQRDVTHYIFTDFDIAVVDNLSQIFHAFPDCHVALTFRNNKEQPLNSGFIAVRGTTDGILRAKNLLEAILEAYGSKFMKASRMLGDQLAIAWVIKSEPKFDMKRFTKQQAFTELIGGASVLFLPCATHNWTPPEGAGQFHGMPLNVKVVHFKGSRKRLMLEAWNFLNSSSSDVSDMLCLVLKSGRTKYDF